MHIQKKKCVDKGIDFWGEKKYKFILCMERSYSAVIHQPNMFI
jgi:hypothetical protein